MSLSANNGINVYNNVIRLGGTITGDTLIKTVNGAGIFIDETNNQPCIFNGDINFINPIALISIPDNQSISFNVSDPNSGNGYSENINLNSIQSSIINNNLSSDFGIINDNSVSTLFFKNNENESSRYTLINQSVNNNASEIYFQVKDNNNNITSLGIINNIYNKGIRVTLPSGHTFSYTDNYSTSFSKYSLVDKNYVTGFTENVTGNLKLTTIGKGIFIKEGINSTLGVISLTGGTAFIATTRVTSNSRIFVQRQIDSGIVGASYSINKSIGNGFTITSKNGNGLTNIDDFSNIAWHIIEGI